MRPTLVRILLLLVVAPLAGAAQELPRDAGLTYRVSLKDSATHRLHVEIEFPDNGIQLQLPVWNALYQVRDFAQYVSNLEPRQCIVKEAANAWTVRPDCTHRVSFDYYADAAGPFGTQVSAEHAFINWAEVLPYTVTNPERTLRVQLVDLPDGWTLRDASEFCHGAKCGTLTEATRYSVLADTPLEIGRFAETSFQQAGATYHIAVHADASDYDMTKVRETVQRITAAAVDYMQDRPFDDYTFLYHFPRGPAGGGMEHSYSTAIDVNTARMKAEPLGFESVTAHEFFHLWNVKRIRPRTLEPVDYTGEQHSRALWFSEGCTSTVAEHLLVRAGLIEEATFLKRLAQQIQELQSRPARLTQSVEESSLETWYDKYPYYRTPERSISYYNKGQLVGVLLDLRMRELTSGRRSLRDLFQYMNQRWAKQHQYFDDSESVRLAAEVLTGDDFKDFFSNYVAGTEELPHEHLFETVGLFVSKSEKTVASIGFATARSTLGMVVTRVEPSTDSARQGVAAGDLIIRINGKAATGVDLAVMIGTMNPADELRLDVRTNGGEREIVVRLEAQKVIEYSLVEAPTASAAQKARRAAWLRGDSEGARP